jgi:antitoxin (DNA-binding transcriptional repressor) of toxin-antitoxin stability system
VEAGEEIVIARNGTPVARLVAHQPRHEPRKPGRWKGRGWISPDFDAPDPELERLFYEGELFPGES